VVGGPRSAYGTDTIGRIALGESKTHRGPNLGIRLPHGGEVGRGEPFGVVDLLEDLARDGEVVDEGGLVCCQRRVSE
jgi:hypothetical protein